MPSATYTLMQGWFQEAARTRGPSDLAADREQAAGYAQMYQPIPGVDARPEGRLRDGSWLMTPEHARDDVVILYVHGGGFRTGLAAGARGLGAHLALAARARVLLPEYRLAPEDPFPAGLDDCLAAFDLAAGLAPGVVVAGESAGANLALAVLLRRVREKHPGVLAGVLHSGVFDLRRERFTKGSWTGNGATDLLLPEELGHLMHDDYLAGHPADDPLASPLAGDLDGLPPLFLQVSGAERLLDDSMFLADRAARAGVHVELEVWPRMFHAWHMAAGFLPEATEAVARGGAFIGRVAAGRVVDGAALAEGPTSLHAATNG
ncbi:alpha/beta hydrolase fold domain-containing protein [Streptomyces sp. AS02]|uniref:alpha/beta hydrolase fold domain-containing protein n=1 Tax=Streptomyces sp. AS02 TaxID=2938946 RepID=UPI002021CF69|nr:alpha/beta hydrolase fold domain-containing protein [Streptomyces sp. AS02]MCL8014898.1 alpha/beta hydrolase [Streptomyces sp. AS02]